MRALVSSASDHVPGPMLLMCMVNSLACEKQGEGVRRREKQRGGVRRCEKGWRGKEREGEGRRAKAREGEGKRGQVYLAGAPSGPTGGLEIVMGW